MYKKTLDYYICQAQDLKKGPFDALDRTAQFISPQLDLSLSHEHTWFLQRLR